jgi:hypothetical protein
VQHAEAISDLGILLESERARLIAERLLAEHHRHDDMRAWDEHRDHVQSRNGVPWTPELAPLWMGAQYGDLSVPGWELSQWVTRGLLFVGYKSRSMTEYRLVDPEATEMALRAFTAAPEAPAEEETAGIPEDLFDVVYGLDEVKRNLRSCLEATAPVHALLLGSYGSAKSLLLEELARCGPSYYMYAPLTSKAGLNDYLLSPNPCRYLRVEEIDKAQKVDMDPLLDLMESGRVTVTKHGKRLTRHVQAWVFATANTIEPLRGALLDRFMVLRIPDLDSDSYVATAAAMLARREGLDAELAQEIAVMCVTRTPQLRRARDIGRMCHGDRRLARDLVESLLPSRP